MKIIIEFNTDNSAFTEDFEYQVNKILENVKIAITADNLSGKNIRDFNGNIIGNFKVEYK